MRSMDNFRQYHLCGGRHLMIKQPNQNEVMFRETKKMKI